MKEEQGPVRPMMRPLATFSFFIFLKTFSFFHSPRPSFLLVPPSSSSLLPPGPSFFPRPAMSKSFRICKRPFFIDFDESITDGPTDRRTRPLMEMRTHLKRGRVRQSNGRTNQGTDQPTDEQTNKQTERRKSPLIKMRRF